MKNGKKGFDRSVDRPVELHFAFYFQQNVYGGGSMAEGRRQRAAKSPESPSSPVIERQESQSLI
jgi:hypothetical protein